MKPLKHLLASSATALLFGCEATNRDPAEGRSLTDSTTVTILSSAQLQALRNAWSAVDPAIISQSKAGRNDIRWSLDYIATIESGVVTQCSKLNLVAIKQLSVANFIGKDSQGKLIHFTPQNFYESWIVDACGKAKEWRLFNEGTDVQNPLRVILWSAA